MKYFLATVNFLFLLVVWIATFAIPAIVLFSSLYLTTLGKSSADFNRLVGQLVVRLDGIFNLMTTGNSKTCLCGVVAHQATLGNEVALIMMYFIDGVIMRQPGYCANKTKHNSVSSYKLPF